MRIHTIKGICNCYIVDDGQIATIIDPGVRYTTVTKYLDKHALKAEMVLLTHGHFDHISCVDSLALLAGAKVYIHPDDRLCLFSDEASLKTMLGSPGITRTPAYAVHDLQDGQTVGAFTVLHTPGHTPGCCVFACGDALFTGDTLFAGDCGRYDLPGGDGRLLSASLKRLAALDTSYTVYPGHGETTELAKERENNPYLRGLPVC